MNEWIGLREAFIQVLIFHTFSTQVVVVCIEENHALKMLINV